MNEMIELMDGWTARWTDVRIGGWMDDVRIEGWRRDDKG